jgi:hypothetical protein
MNEQHEPAGLGEDQTSPAPATGTDGAVAQNAALQSGGAGTTAPEQAAPCPVKPDGSDALFALLAFVLGYLFSRWVLFDWEGWGTAAFTALYLASASVYLVRKGAHFSAAAWFWLAVTFLTGLSFAFWSGTELSGVKALLLFGAAVYFVMSLTKTQISGKTDNKLFLDGVNLVFVIPFRNIIEQYKSLGAFGCGKKGIWKTGFSVAAGVVLAILLLLLLTPLLLTADSGGFAKIVVKLTSFFRFNLTTVTEFLSYSVPAVFVAAYLFGLVSGNARRKGTDAFTQSDTDKAASSLRFVMPVTVFTVLGTVCALYLIFIGTQLPYFFSAFSGARRRDISSMPTTPEAVSLSYA